MDDKLLRDEFSMLNNRLMELESSIAGLTNGFERLERHVDRSLSDLRIEMNHGFMRAFSRVDKLDRRLEAADKRFDKIDAGLAELTALVRGLAK